MNKKRILIITSCLLLIIVAYITYSFISTARTKNHIRNTSVSFINIWANFSDRYSEDYLVSIKPFLSDSLTKQYQEDVTTVGQVNKNFGIKPTAAVFKDISVISIKKSGNEYQVRLSGKLKYSFENNFTNKIAFIRFKKDNRSWLVQEVYFED
jgi:hypothetical protein